MYIIHVNRHTITRNRKQNEKNPPLAVRKGRSGKATYCKNVVIAGPSRIIYSPDSPLKCGAVVWIEAEGPVEADGQEV